MVSLVKVFFISALILMNGCDFTSQTRAVGYFRLGAVDALKVKETYFPESKILLHYDEKGFSALSTACTYDLSPLVKKEENGQEVLVSTETESKYDAFGKVLHGPTKANLPFYKLTLDSAVYGGPKDTLYVHVGYEVGEAWRLKL